MEEEKFKREQRQRAMANHERLLTGKRDNLMIYRRT